MKREKFMQWVIALYAVAILVALGSLAKRSHLIPRMGKVEPGSIAILHIYGPIQTSMTSSAWNSQDADDIARRLHQWSEDDDIKAIILRINSPGGTVGAVQEIFTELQRCKARGKKVVASLGDVAASGGFYLASGADRIVSNPGTITGSIGVILQFGNLESLFQKVGVRLQVIKSGAHKDIGSPARSLTDEERRLLQASIDDAYAQFFDVVMQGRKLTKAQVAQLADGRIFTGREAQKLGLVDELGNSQDAIQVAIKLANLAPKPPIITDQPKSVMSLLRHASSQLSSDPIAALGLNSPSVSLEYRLR
jgi:protease-4